VALLVVGLTSQIAVVGLASADPAPPPPTPVPPSGSPSPFPSVLRTPTDTVARPTVRAGAALVADLSSGDVLYAKDADRPRPVASLTKVMTALVVLERADLHDMVRIDARAVFERDDYGAGSTIGLRAGERLTVRQLLAATLLGSANDAADALAIHVSGGVDAFVSLMQRRAHQLGMARTRFFSANGLDDRGRSTPSDLVLLSRAAVSTPGFTALTGTKFITIRSPQRAPRRIQNRNVLLWLYPGAFGMKTGSTVRAGYCLIATARRGGRRLVTIVLDAPGEAFSDAATLLNYGFGGFEERTIVREGEDVGVVSLPGGDVPVVTATSMERLVPIDMADDIRRRVRVDPKAAFPPAPGDAVATLVMSAPGLDLGRIPLIAPTIPPPTPQDGVPWWARALGAIGRAAGDAVAAVAGD
jgi:D-alanyl-D-alanine carboxypeptidase (penicillin-binding protein 5/6)